jgi:hypothetical protein
MMHELKSRRHSGGFRAGALVLCAIAFSACDTSDRLRPTDEGTSTDISQLSVAAVPPGLAFASFSFQPSQLNSVHTGLVGSSSPSTLLTYLGQVKARGGRVILRLHGDQAVRNADGSFNLELWKTQVARYQNTNFDSYITDGTIVGHFVTDEPQFPSRWGGKVIPQATVEAMAKYSKQLWRTMFTIVNAPPTWLAGSTTTYVYLDAGWAMYWAKMGSASTWIANQVNKAKTKGLGVVAGLNVLDGGDGSSGFAGNYPRKWAMSANELRSYGSALLSQTYQTYVCAFTMWKYTSTYYGRSDIKSAMAELSIKAKNHVRTSCRQ